MTARILVLEPIGLWLQARIAAITGFPVHNNHAIRLHDAIYCANSTFYWLMPHAPASVLRGHFLVSPLNLQFPHVNCALSGNSNGLTIAPGIFNKSSSSWHIYNFLLSVL